MSASSFFHIRLDRRRLLQNFLVVTGGAITGEIYAEALTLTPRATEGPYYPDHLPLDQDNDLTKIIDGKAPAGGVIAEFGGRLLNPDGKPLANHVIEMWQADTNGCYIHSRGVQRGKERDPHFQGYGKIETNAKGEYRFRTIKPGLYTGRTLHWHIAVKRADKRMLTTQLFIAGVPQNDRDGILRSMGTEEQRLSVIREFKPKETGSADLLATWDIVIGSTPEEPEQRRRSMPPAGGANQNRDGAGRASPPAGQGRPEPLTDRELEEAIFGKSLF
ncbi:MAG: intradiol ring-cleavage dioxygenase [Verrucomicrobiaceae bacterium]|nr:intradiol ring-cleavage dioxygenase [Verrucomicrobiaceae bacterium]